MKKNKKKKKVHLKKLLKGFTLVELLAVIVILAIIMIIAIPNVLNTMQTARKKSMVEFAQKLLKRAEEINVENQLKGYTYPLPAEKNYILYDIRKDLGLSSAGDYYGLLTLVIMNDANKTSWYTITILDDEYRLQYDQYGGLTDHSKMEITVEGNVSSSENLKKLFESNGVDYKNVDFVDFTGYIFSHSDKEYQSIALINAGKRQQIYSTKPGCYEECPSNSDNPEEEYTKMMSLMSEYFASKTNN